LKGSRIPRIKNLSPLGFHIWKQLAAVNCYKRSMWRDMWSTLPA